MPYNFEMHTTLWALRWAVAYIWHQYLIRPPSALVCSPPELAANQQRAPLLLNTRHCFLHTSPRSENLCDKALASRAAPCLAPPLRATIILLLGLVCTRTSCAPSHGSCHASSHASMRPALRSATRHPPPATRRRVVICW